MAIIVILAIIAVITIPIILNVIENSRRGAAIDSAYGYKDAISKYYVSNMIEKQDISLDGFYLVESGKLKKGSSDSNPVEISFSGTIPSDGSLVINKGSVEAGCMTLGDYKVTMLNDTIYKAEKGKCNGIPVYYDVTSEDGKECKDNYSIENSNTGKQNGCMKWYIYNADESTYTMILDHNVTGGMRWSTSDKNINGPTNITTALKGIFGNWKWVEKLNNYTVSWIDEHNEEQHYTIDYSDGYKARLIEAEEIANITGASKSEIEGGLGWNVKTSPSYFYFGRSNWDVPDPTMTTTNPFAWLYNNTAGCATFGCEVEGPTDIDGYWTSSPYTTGADAALVVGSSGYLSGFNVGSNSSSFGIRPVIKVLKENLK